MRSSMWLRLMTSSRIGSWQLLILGRFGESRSQREAAFRKSTSGRVALSWLVLSPVPNAERFSDGDWDAKLQSRLDMVHSRHTGRPSSH